MPRAQEEGEREETPPPRDAYASDQQRELHGLRLTHLHAGRQHVATCEAAPGGYCRRRTEECCHLRLQEPRQPLTLLQSRQLLTCSKVERQPRIVTNM